MMAKSSYRLLGRINGYLQPQQLFDIKKGYHHSVSAETFDDTGNTDEWQQEVYNVAADLARECGYASVIDVGCGSAYKLLHMPGIQHTIGIEVEPTYSWLCGQYPERQWLLFDDVQPKDLTAGLVICADVIEHLENPDTLLEFISDITFQHLIISTPDRDLVAGKNDYGPPENTAHFREWNCREFRDYMGHYFTVEAQQIFTDKTSTQVVICKK